MASINGGIIGKQNNPTDETTAGTVTSFTSSGTFTTQSTTTGIEYLVVAGGGGGGSRFGGGGGAGGYKTNFGGTLLTVSASTSYAVTVG